MQLAASTKALLTTLIAQYNNITLLPFGPPIRTALLLLERSVDVRRVLQRCPR
jgi:hypothetical protein